MLAGTKYFVNRLDEIGRFSLALNSEASEKDFLILMYGQHGIGKTELLLKYLAIASDVDNLRIAYADLSDRDYLGLIEEIVEGLGKTGFEDLDETFDAILSTSQLDRSALERLQEQLHVDRNALVLSEGAGINFNDPVSAGRDMYFVNGPVSLVGPKFEYVFNINSREPEKVEELNQNRITLAFQSCLAAIARTQPIVLLLDHWDNATDYLKNWLENHLLKWSAQFKLKKALIVLCQMNFPEKFEDKQGILPLVIPPFSREIALEFWIKNGLPEEEFNRIGGEVYSIPSILKLEVGKRGFNRSKR